MRARHVVSIGVLFLLILGCLKHPDPIVLSPRDSRIDAAAAAFANYHPQDQELIRNGGMRVGLDEHGLFLSRGAPAFYWNTILNGQWCRAALYGLDSPDAIDAVAYVCNGQVVHIARVQPKLPCWRISSAGRRAVERAEYFDQQPLAQQWELLAGILRRGQTPQDVYIAFGEPYNTGSEAREDGTNAMIQVFLDSTGDSYGLYVTLIDTRVSAWRFPPDRQLTPEAQQRRLDAMEQRLVAQMREIEARSIERHREEMALLQQVQMESAQMVQSLATNAEAATAAILGVPSQQPPGGVVPPGDPGGGGGGGGGGTTTGGRTLTVNGCQYTDGPNGHLGDPCSPEQPCPASYTCNLMTRRSGVCVPEGQRCGQ